MNKTSPQLDKALGTLLKARWRGDGVTPMAHPHWYEDAAVDLRRLGLPGITTHWPRAKPATVEARGAALVFCGSLTSDTPRPEILPTHDAGVQLQWVRADAHIRLVFVGEGLVALTWERVGDHSPAWARGVLARALHGVR